MKGAMGKIDKCPAILRNAHRAVTRSSDWRGKVARPMTYGIERRKLDDSENCTSQELITLLTDLIDAAKNDRVIDCRTSERLFATNEDEREINITVRLKKDGNQLRSLVDLIKEVQASEWRESLKVAAGIETRKEVQSKP